MATLKQIEQDLLDSLKTGATDRLATLRLLKSSLANERIKVGHDLNEAEINKLLAKEAKQRRDSIKAFQEGGRTDLAVKEEAELKIIESYLPSRLSPAELAQLIDQVITKLGATEVGQMGSVVAQVRQQAESRVDGAEVAKLVRQRLS